MNTILLSSNSGTTYPLQVYKIGHPLDPGPGIFALGWSTGFFEFNALFVGETDNLADRLCTKLEDHDGYKRAIDMNASQIAILRTTLSVDRIKIVKDIWHGPEPRCTQKSVPSGINKLTG